MDVASLMALIGITTLSARAEVVPTDTCFAGGAANSCNNPGVSSAPNPNCTYGRYCNIDVEFEITSQGGPGAVDGLGYVECENCPDSCASTSTGVSIKCSTFFSKTYTTTWSTDVSASGGINIGFFNKEFGISIGYSTAQSVKVGNTVSVTAKHCTWGQARADAHLSVTGKTAEVVASVSLVTTATGSQCPAEAGSTKPCYTGVVKVKYDGLTGTVKGKMLASGGCDTSMPELPPLNKVSVHGVKSPF